VWGGAGGCSTAGWTRGSSPVGIILGMTVAIYLVVVKYGRDPPRRRRPTARPRADDGAGAQDAEGTTVTSSALALVDVLAAEDTASKRPASRSSTRSRSARSRVAGIDFEITRITLILWIATLGDAAFLVAAVRKPSIVPGKLQFLGRAATRWCGTASPAT
jgi:hypothetical protein